MFQLLACCVHTSLSFPLSTLPPPIASSSSPCIIGELSLELFCSQKNLRVLVCGGDGSVGWLLSAMEDVIFEYGRPPVSTIASDQHKGSVPPTHVFLFVVHVNGIFRLPLFHLVLAMISHDR